MSEVFEVVKTHFNSPVDPYKFQHDVLEEASKFKRILLRIKGGGGKSFMSIWLALYHSIINDIEQIICIVPAPLVTQWGVVWSDFGLNTCEYQGTPAVRRKLNIINADVIIMSRDIFTKEWEVKEFTGKLTWKKVKGERKQVEQFRKVPGRLQLELTKPSCVIYDESAMGLRRTSNTIWKATSALIKNNYFIALSATPISNPEDVFGVLKILRSKAYRDERCFELKHVAKRDYFKKVIAWDNLDVMQANMDSVSVTVPDSAYKELPEIICDRVVYDLTKKHRRNYETLAEDKLLETEDTFIDATESENLWHVLQRYVTAPEGSVNKSLLELLKTYYEEDESPLVIFGNYKVTNRAILDYFGDLACGLWSEFSHKRQQQNLQDFYSGKKKILVSHPVSGGTGTDGIQNVCSRLAFAEVPITSVLMQQCLWRTHRDGQQNTCLARTFTAKGTIQMQLYQACLEKDDLVNKVIHSKESLRKMFSGKSIRE